MGINEIMQIVTQFGVPTAIAFFVLLRLETSNNKIYEAIVELKSFLQGFLVNLQKEEKK